MKPTMLLLTEHRVIERMIPLLKKEMARIEQQDRIDPFFLDRAVDFIRVYVDRTHHGKEENILFREVGKKNLSAVDKRLMDELIEEHQFARDAVAGLVKAKREFLSGQDEAIDVIMNKLNDLVNLYPEHIAKEDKVFFPASMEYLDEAEQENMLEEFREFDRGMIHEKYRSVIEELITKTSKL